MEPERQEVYERIPWETLEQANTSGDRQWLYVGLAGAVALGALAYSFTRSQPVDPVPQAVATVDQQPQAAMATTVPSAPPTTARVPLVMAEADLFAIEPERLIDEATAHAEWFAVEYFSIDGSDESRSALASLLPSGIPLPDAPEGTQVFVDWVGTHNVREVASGRYDVDVMVRSLMSTTERGFVRQPTRMITVPIELGEDGLPRVSGPPMATEAPAGGSVQVALVDVPAEVAAKTGLADDAILGGVQDTDGSWRVVMMETGPDGVRRPATIVVAP